MKKLLDVKQQTDNKYINLYKISYLEDCTTGTYEFASRRKYDNLTAFNQNDKVDAIKVLPYFWEDGKLNVVVLREFRQPLNKYIYGVVAGLVEEGEDPIVSAQREIYEEIGGQTIDIQPVGLGAYVSAGLTDEKLQHFIAEVQLEGRQHLERGEDICYKVLSLDEIEKFTQENEFCVSGLLLLQMFYNKFRDKV